MKLSIYKHSRYIQVVRNFLLMADCRICGHVTDRQCRLMFGSSFCLKQQLSWLYYCPFCLHAYLPLKQFRWLFNFSALHHYVSWALTLNAHWYRQGFVWAYESLSLDLWRCIVTIHVLRKIRTKIDAPDAHFDKLYLFSNAKAEEIGNPKC
jgi:hypothetical protein